MQLHETLRACALDDLARLTSLLPRENDPKADREFCESLLRAPAHFKLTPREHAAAHAWSALAAYELLSREYFAQVIDSVPDASDASNPAKDNERRLAGRWEVFRLSALSYARRINDPILIEGFQPPAASNAVEKQDPQRRLDALRALNGDVAWQSGEWRITGIAKLVKQERVEGRARHTEKTVRIDLREAAETEKREGTKNLAVPKKWYP